ncbi:hypothetical protein OU800_14470 [Pseudomonas sp. GOM7]|nr:hypothetical protein [Pseudomonas sp. GOM7]WAJ35829.1 hypothetical protein OU800_14470 [Pseudomonas sp. GOM7]
MVQYQQVLQALHEAVAREDYERVRQLLREVVSGYRPEGEIVDWLYLQKRTES